MAAKKEVAKVEEATEVEVMSAEMQAEMELLGASSMEDIETDDLQLPQLALVQATSKYVDEDDAKPGRFINTLTRSVYESPEFVVGAYRKTRIRFEEGKIGGAPLCTSPNALDGYGDPGDELRDAGKIGPLGGGNCKVCPKAVLDFASGNIGDCALQHNYIGVAIPGEGEGDADDEIPVAAIMSRTSVKTAKQLNTLLKTSKFPWQFVYRLTSVKKSNDNGTYFVWEVKRSRPATMAEMRKAMEIAKMIKDAGVNVTVDQGRGNDEAEVVDDTNQPF